MPNGRTPVALCLATLLVTTCTCGEREDGPWPAGDPLPRDSAGGDPGSGDCPRLQQAADRQRFVVVAHHNDFDNLQRTFEVYALSQTGLLSFTGHTFELGGRATYGDIVFTPDGEIGLVALDNDANGDNQGTLGVFRLAKDGTPTVIHEAFTGGFFASSVVMGPAGRTAYVIEGDAQEVGGGISSVTIGCDGTLVDEGSVMPTHLAAELLFAPADPSRALLIAGEPDPVVTSYDTRLYAWPPLDEALAYVDLFADDSHIVADATLTVDGRYLLVADGSPYNGLPDRIGVAEVLSDGLIMTQVLDSHAPEPTALLPSPYNNAVLVLTAGAGANDTIHWLSYDATDSVTPFEYGGELSYQGGRTQLPSNATMIRRGTLAGRVLVPELSAIRQVQFNANGTVADVGLFDTGDGIEFMVGAIGVQP